MPLPLYGLQSQKSTLDYELPVAYLNTTGALKWVPLLSQPYGFAAYMSPTKHNQSKFMGVFPFSPQSHLPFPTSVVLLLLLPPGIFSCSQASQAWLLKFSHFYKAKFPSSLLWDALPKLCLETVLPSIDPPEWHVCPCLHTLSRSQVMEG